MAWLEFWNLVIYCFFCYILVYGYKDDFDIYILVMCKFKKSIKNVACDGVFWEVDCGKGFY